MNFEEIKLRIGDLIIDLNFNDIYIIKSPSYYYLGSFWIKLYSLIHKSENSYPSKSLNVIKSKIKCKSYQLIKVKHEY